MNYFKDVCLVVIILNVAFSKTAAHARAADEVEDLGLNENQQIVGVFVGSKQENESVLLNNDRTQDSKTSAEVSESIENDGVYEGLRRTQYERGWDGEAEPGSGREPGSRDAGMGQVLQSDHKERETLTDQSSNKDDTEINPRRNKTDGTDKYEESSVSYEPDVSDTLPSENSKVKQETSTALNANVEPHEIFQGSKYLTVEPTEMSTSIPEPFKAFAEKLTLEETIGDVWKKDIPEGKHKDLLNSAKDTSESSTMFKFEELNDQPLYMTTNQTQEDILVNKNDCLTEKCQKEVTQRVEYDGNITTATPSTHMFDNDETVEVLQYVSSNDYPVQVARVGSLEAANYNDDSTKSTVSDDFIIDKSNKMNQSIMKGSNAQHTLTNIVIAEKLRLSESEQEDAAQSLRKRLLQDIDNKTANTPQPLRDYEDKSEEDKIVLKSLLNDHSSFKKEKIEPGVLFEDCTDCDLRLLSIRPSEQREPSEEDSTLPTTKIKFVDLPEGRRFHINSLGLSDGIFIFSYISEFLSWIQPNEFPVELLRDALRREISWVSLIMQSLQVEAGFVACLVAGVLLALAVPVVVLYHACYRVGSKSADQSEHSPGNCKRRTLVFILELLLILLFAGMVAMFFTNEQLSGAVVRSSTVLQTSLNDVSSFVHNSHLQLHFLVTQSLDQALQAVYADLDNVETLLGRPIQRELVQETGLDVALDTLGDLTRGAKEINQKVELFLDEARMAQEMLVSTREKLSDLRQQVDLFRRACGPRDRTLCDTIDSSGLDATLRLDKIKSDERLVRMRRLGGAGLEAAALEARQLFQAVPRRVEADTRDAREGVRRQLSKQRAEVDEQSVALEKFARELTAKVADAQYQADFWTQDLDQYEYWRWVICVGGGAAVLMIWTMLLCSLCCGCCGSEKAAGPTILLTVVLLCLFSTALWTAALLGLLVGGHGEVFVCRPLHDEPDYPVLSRLVDQPGVFYDHPRGGLIANLLYQNDSLDVPVRQVLQDCQDNRPIYPTLGLQRVWDVEAAVTEQRWAGVSTQARGVSANISSLPVLTPALQEQLTELLNSLSVNFTQHRIQMSKPVSGKDLESFAHQLDNIGHQMRDLATASRMDTLSSRTRRLLDSHVRPLEAKKDSLVYQLTALEVQTGPLQRQVNQSLSHLKTIQFFINSQGGAIAQRKSREYAGRLVSYVAQFRQHVTDALQNNVSPCRPLWDIFNSARLFLCRHTMDPLNGYWFATMWCLLVLLAATPVCLKLVDLYRARGSRATGSPESLVVAEHNSGWSSPGYDIKCSKEHKGIWR